MLLPMGLAQAGDLRVSSKEPVIVTTPDQWQAAKDKPPTPNFPIETYRLVPPSGRNAICLVSILDKDKKTFADPAFLKTALRGECQPYVKSPDELPKVELKELKIQGGLGFYANFVDPDLVGKPVKPGDFKTATPILLSIGSSYLIKITILCDELGGADYREALKIVESIKVRKPEA